MTIQFDVIENPHYDKKKAGQNNFPAKYKYQVGAKNFWLEQDIDQEITDWFISEFGEHTKLYSNPRWAKIGSGRFFLHKEEDVVLFVLRWGNGY